MHSLEADGGEVASLEALLSQWRRTAAPLTGAISSWTSNFFSSPLGTVYHRRLRSRGENSYRFCLLLSLLGGRGGNRRRLQQQARPGKRERGKERRKERRKERERERRNRHNGVKSIKMSPTRFMLSLASAAKVAPAPAGMRFVSREHDQSPLEPKNK